MNTTHRFLLCLTAVVAASASAANWPQWRGPHFNGSTDEKHLPDQWSKTENIAWSLDLPGPSAATPVIWGDHVFVPSTDVRAKTLLALCVDRRSGKARWQHKIADGSSRDERSTFASASPVTDGWMGLAGSVRFLGMRPPEQVADFLPGKTLRKRLEAILSLCMPGHLEYRIRVLARRRGFHLGAQLNPGYLGYTCHV